MRWEVGLEGSKLCLFAELPDHGAARRELPRRMRQTFTLWFHIPALHRLTIADQCHGFERCERNGASDLDHGEPDL